MNAYKVVIEPRLAAARSVVIHAENMYCATKEAESMLTADDLKDGVFMAVRMAVHGPNGDVSDCCCNACTAGIGDS